MKTSYNKIDQSISLFSNFSTSINIFEPTNPRANGL